MHPTASRRAKRSFTLSRNALGFLEEWQRQKQLPSLSEALDRLLLGLRRQSERRRFDTAIVGYYDALTPGERQDVAGWGEAGLLGLEASED